MTRAPLVLGPPEFMSAFVRACLFEDLAPVSLPARVGSDDAREAIRLGIPERGIAVGRRVGIDDAPLRELMAAAELRAWISLRLEAELGKLAQVFHGHGIRIGVIKGLALTRTGLRDRSYTDLDVFVDSENRQLAVRVLLNAGWRPWTESLVPRSGQPWLGNHALTFVSPEDVSVDLHVAVPPLVWGRKLDLSWIAAQGRWDPELNVYLPSAAQSFVIAALQLIHNGGRIARGWRDVAWLHAMLARSDVTAAGREAAALRLDDVCAAVLRSVAEVMGMSPTSDAYASPSLARALRLRAIWRWQDGRKLGIARLAGLPTVEAIRFASLYAWPDEAFLQARTGRRGFSSRPAWWWRSVRKAMTGLTSR